MSDQDLPTVIEPSNVEHLNDIVVDAIISRWNIPPLSREPGVYAMRFPSVAILIVTDADPLLVSVSGPLVTDIADVDTAIRHVNELNKAMPPFTFVVQDDALAVTTHVPASPFVPEHLLQAISAVTDIASGLGHQLAETFGGVVAERADIDAGS